MDTYEKAIKFVWDTIKSALDEHVWRSLLRLYSKKASLYGEAFSLRI